MQQFGCHAVSGTAYGKAGDWPFSAKLLSRGASPEILIRFLAAGDMRKPAATQNREKEDYITWHTGATSKGEPVLEAFLTLPSDFYARATVRDVLKAAPHLLAQQGPPPNICPLCGLAGCDDCAALDDVYHPAHTACLQNRLAVPDEDTVLPMRVSGSVIRGILGALLGALVAALPIWSLAFTDGRIYWALYAFIPLLSGLCYRLLRGKANLNIAGISVLTSSLLATFILEQIWYWLVLTTTYGTNIPFMQSVQHYLSGHSIFSSVREMLFCLLAVVVGFVGITIFLRRYAAEGQEPQRVILGATHIRQTALSCNPPAKKDAAEETSETDEPPVPQA